MLRTNPTYLIELTQKHTGCIDSANCKQVCLFLQTTGRNATIPTLRSGTRWSVVEVLDEQGPLKCIHLFNRSTRDAQPCTVFLLFSNRIQSVHTSHCKMKAACCVCCPHFASRLSAPQSFFCLGILARPLALPQSKAEVENEMTTLGWGRLFLELLIPLLSLPELIKHFGSSNLLIVRKILHTSKHTSNSVDLAHLGSK